jgi:hypothetical protein
VISRPDIAYAVSRAGQVMANPTAEDFQAVKRILRYLQGTKEVGIQYSKGGNIELRGYADSNWAGDKKSRKSTTGYIFLLGGTAISWSSKKQNSVALSSTEAEYMAACAAVQEAIYLRTLLLDLREEQKEASTLYQDNQGAIAMGNNSISNKRSKHISIKYHFVREKVKEKEIKLEYKETTKMIADCLTKPVGKQVMNRLLPKIFGN